MTVVISQNSFQYMSEQSPSIWRTLTFLQKTNKHVFNTEMPFWDLSKSELRCLFLNCFPPWQYTLFCAYSSSHFFTLTLWPQIGFNWQLVQGNDWKTDIKGGWSLIPGHFLGQAFSSQCTLFPKLPVAPQRSDVCLVLSFGTGMETTLSLSFRFPIYDLIKFSPHFPF